MTDPHRAETASPTLSDPHAEDQDDLTLGLDKEPGVGQELLKSLPPNAVVAYRGEPTASERALLSWQMTDEQRYEFAAGMERVSDRLREMTPRAIEDFLRELDAETRLLKLDIEIRSEDAPGSQDDAAPSAPAVANPRRNGNASRRTRIASRLVPGLLARGVRRPARS
jgi:hypothetical protein